MGQRRQRTPHYVANQDTNDKGREGTSNEERKHNDSINNHNNNNNGNGNNRRASNENDGSSSKGKPTTRKEDHSNTIAHTIGWNNNNNNKENNPVVGGGHHQAFVRLRNTNHPNERQIRLEQPLAAGERWPDIYSGDSTTNGLFPTTLTTVGPWQILAFILLGVVVGLSAIFLHMVAENGESDDSHHYRRHHNHYYYHQTSYDKYRIRQQRNAATRSSRINKTRKKKTDESSEDEEDDEKQQQQQHDNDGPQNLRYDRVNNNNNNTVSTSCGIPGYTSQEPRHRRSSYSEPDTPPQGGVGTGVGGGGAMASGRSTYYLPPVNSACITPSAKNMNTSASHRRGVSPGNSFSNQMKGGGGAGDGRSPGLVLLPAVGTVAYTSSSSNGVMPSPDHSRRGVQVSLSGRLRPLSNTEGRNVPVFPSPLRSNTVHTPGLLLTTPSTDSPLPNGQPRNIGAGGSSSSSNVPRNHIARPLNASNFSSFASTTDANSTDGHSASENASRWGSLDDDDTLWSTSLHLPNVPVTASMRTHDSPTGSQRYIHGSHQEGLLLSPGNYEAETPQIGNIGRKILSPKLNASTNLPYLSSCVGPPSRRSYPAPMVPFMPALEISTGTDVDGSDKSRRFRYSTLRPPRSVLLDELSIVLMETGNSTQWAVRQPPTDVPDELIPSSTNRHDLETLLDADVATSSDREDKDYSSEAGSDIPIPSGDPRGGIIHKRDNLTEGTDAYKSLQSHINFQDLKLEEVIGGGGFGQVWRATWCETPVAVKVLTGSAQNTHVAKAILEEFKAEINLLKGMRHPNICLYMGACVKPPNRAIVTELAAHGSVWDALRLPLSPPYVAVDGTPRDSWPLQLYLPGEHGTPPSDASLHRILVPHPPRGTWPWQLVKLVAIGAARGMAYLHHGDPPVLHRDLKSANLLLDQAYTVKVCDFGLSRLKAQARSMTGNCGTVQWMAPEVLANMAYDEKADVFSYGIILWELLSRECPYEGMTAIQCALAVLNRDKRPDIPKWCPPPFHALIKACVKKDPAERPDFTTVIQTLNAMKA